MPSLNQLQLFRRPKRPDWDYVQQSLEVVGMASLADRQIGELSGGQAQRVTIARAMVARPAGAGARS